MTDTYLYNYPDEVNKIFNRVKFEIGKATEKTLFGRKPTSKKIKRRLSYGVIWWESNCRKVKYFHSAKRMRKFVNHLHSWYNDVIEIDKTWCYREHSPRHKWYYESWKPNQFICLEKY